MDRSKSKQRVVLNSGVGIVSKIVIAVMGLVLRRLFLHHLGAELSGLSNVFLNIIDFLNLATSGFMTVLMPKLYDYSAIDDYNGLNRTMRIARRFYNLIAVIILALGFICSFFVHAVIADNPYPLILLRIVFLVQVITQCIRLLSTPWSTIFGVREQSYLAIWYETVVSVVVYITQAIIILSLENYLFYLLANLAGQIVLLMVLIIKVRSKFPWLSKKLDIENEEVLFFAKNFKITFPIQVANFVFMSTDSIIISSAIGLVAANHYGNYMTIATTLIAMFTMVHSATINYFGNRVRDDSPAEEKEVFLRILTYICYVCGVVCAVIYSVTIDDFLAIWIGAEYIQPFYVAVLFGAYLFSQMIIGGVQGYVGNMGLFKDELVANVAAAIVNLLISIMAVQYMDIAGVLLGTIIGNLVRYVLRAYGTYKNIGKKLMTYFGVTAGYIAAYGAILIVAIYVCRLINFDGRLLQLLIKGLIAAGLSAGFSMAVFGWRWEEKAMSKLIADRIKTRIGRDKQHEED